MSHSFSLVKFPVRPWDDWLRLDKKATVCFKLSHGKDRIKTVRTALTHELTTSKQVRSGHTLNRARLNTSKKKLWRQKGTGRARAGSKSSPLWKGGAVVFGPRSDQAIKPSRLNRKVWKKAVESLFYNKRGNTIVVQGPWNHDESSHVLNFNQLSSLGLREQTNCLFLFPNYVSLARIKHTIIPNRTGIMLASFSTLKCIDLLRADVIILVI